MNYGELTALGKSEGFVTNHVIDDELQNGRLGDRTRAWLALPVPLYVLNRINTWSMKETGKLFIAHTTDTDCTIDPETGCCSLCGVLHGDPCPECGGRGLHIENCELIGAFV